MKEVKEHPKRLTMTRMVSSMAKVVPARVVAIFNPAVLLSPRKPDHASLASQGGSRQASRHCGNAIGPEEPQRSPRSVDTNPHGASICAGR
jgi:hypothetical protein